MRNMYMGQVCPKIGYNECICNDIEKSKLVPINQPLNDYV